MQQDDQTIRETICDTLVDNPAYMSMADPFDFIEWALLSPIRDRPEDVFEVYLKEVRGEPVHKDVLGQRIWTGSKVLWGGGRTQCAGFGGGPVTVAKSAAKRVGICRGNSITYVDPRDLVVVDFLVRE